MCKPARRGRSEPACTATYGEPRHFPLPAPLGCQLGPGCLGRTGAHRLNVKSSLTTKAVVSILRPLKAFFLNWNFLTSCFSAGQTMQE